MVKRYFYTVDTGVRFSTGAPLLRGYMKEFRDIAAGLFLFGFIFSCIILYFMACCYGMGEALTFFSTLPTLVAVPLSVFTIVFGTIFIIGSTGAVIGAIINQIDK